MELLNWSKTSIHDEDGVRLRDRQQDTKQFAQNSIGAMNGMNHPDIEIPADADGKWFLKYL
jgi:hypothetical protein